MRRVAVIRQGKLLAEGPPAELGARNGRHRVEIRGSGLHEGSIAAIRIMPGVKSAEVVNGHLVLDMKEDGMVPQIVRMLVEQGVQIEEVRKDKASLEDVFLTLVEEDIHA